MISKVLDCAYVSTSDLKLNDLFIAYMPTAFFEVLLPYPNIH